MIRKDLNCLTISGKGAMGMFGKKWHEEAIYESHYMVFWIKVYPNRVDFTDGLGSNSIPINQIASVRLDRIGISSNYS